MFVGVVEYTLKVFYIYAGLNFVFMSII